MTYLVTYSGRVNDDDRVFKALADPTRRFLLDRLFERDGRTLTELESELEMTRFGVMKHLRVLEDAGLVVTRRSGREKLHFLNPVPIRLIHDRWIDKYTERQVSALADLKNELEDGMSAMTRSSTTTQVYQVYIKATPEAIWDAITTPEWTQRYGYGGEVELDLRPGGAYKALRQPGDEVVRHARRRGRRRGHRGRPAAPARADLASRLGRADRAPRRRAGSPTRSSPGSAASTKLTLVHELEGAPLTAAMIAGSIEGAGGGWPYVLSDLKTLLETGEPLGD